MRPTIPTVALRNSDALESRLGNFLTYSPVYTPSGSWGAKISKEAAVLVLLDKRDDGWYVFLTLRSAHLRAHAGEVSFPGGKREPADRSPIDTALREANEETGLPSSSARPLGVLQNIFTRFGVLLHPVIAILVAPFEAIPNEEVDTCFWAPLSIFLDDKNHEIVEFKSVNLRTHKFEYQGHTIFGITSFICILVSMAVYDTYPKFPVSGIADSNRPLRESIRDVLALNSKFPDILDKDEYRSFVTKNKL